MNSVEGPEYHAQKLGELIRSQAMAAGHAWLDQRITAGKLRGTPDPELISLIERTRELVLALGDIVSAEWFVKHRTHLRIDCWRDSLVLSTLVNAKLQRAKELAGDTITIVRDDQTAHATITCHYATDARDATPTVQVKAVANG